MYADLHIHTTASDGMSTPAEVVAAAKAKGLSAIAITDHDSTDGIAEAIDEGIKHQIEVIPGIELSTLSGDREIHILGYYPDWKSSLLQEKLAFFIEARQNRAVKMLEKLDKLGIVVSVQRVEEIAESSFIGRPHIARALLENGYINEISEAFTEKYIGRGGRAYVERFKLNPAEGIDMLLKTGAIPVLAHPGNLSQGPPMLEQEIGSLVVSGLRGIEVYYSRHTAEQKSYYNRIVRTFDLLVTGGSDCHGYKNSANSLGTVRLPYKYVEALKSEKIKKHYMAVKNPDIGS